MLTRLISCCILFRGRWNCFIVFTFTLCTFTMRVFQTHTHMLTRFIFCPCLDARAAPATGISQHVNQTTSLLQSRMPVGQSSDILAIYRPVLPASNNLRQPQNQYQHSEAAEENAQTVLRLVNLNVA